MEQNGENDSSQENIYPPAGTYIDGRGNEIYFGTEPEFRSFWVFFPAIMNAVSTVYRMIRNHRKTIDLLSNPGDATKEKDPVLDSIGGGHLLKRVSALDSIGGGHLLKRAPIIDGIGGGHLLKRGNDFKEFLMQGNSMKRRPVLDSIGGGHLLKRFVDFKQSYPIKREDETNDTISPEEKFLRNLRTGRDFDTLLGHSFGTSKRFESSPSVGKRNFDEIDNAGFKDYLSKRNFDEIDNAGFSDHLLKRNFDEIDNAGFKDHFFKRNFDEIDNAGFKDHFYKRNFDEIDNAGFKDHFFKRNFDEIDNAGFKDHFYKRNFDEIDNAGFRDYLRLKKSFDEIDNAGFKDYLKRNFDEIDNAGFKDQFEKKAPLKPPKRYPRAMKILSTSGPKMQNKNHLSNH